MFLRSIIHEDEEHSRCCATYAKYCAGFRGFEIRFGYHLQDVMEELWSSCARQSEPTHTHKAETNAYP